MLVGFLINTSCHQLANSKNKYQIPIQACFIHLIFFGIWNLWFGIFKVCDSSQLELKWNGCLLSRFIGSNLSHKIVEKIVILVAFVTYNVLYLNLMQLKRAWNLKFQALFMPYYYLRVIFFMKFFAKKLLQLI